MDLPSMAKVTKLSIERLQEKAKSTPVFAPGLSNLAQTGAVHVTWDDERLARRPAGGAARPTCRMRTTGEISLGKERGGRLKAADIAERVRDLALHSPVSGPPGATISSSSARRAGARCSRRAAIWRLIRWSRAGPTRDGR